MDHQARSEIRLIPSSLGRHDVAGVGDVDDLLHAHRIEREGDLHLTAFEFTLTLFFMVSFWMSEKVVYLQKGLEVVPDTEYGWKNGWNNSLYNNMCNLSDCVGVE